MNKTSLLSRDITFSKFMVVVVIYLMVFDNVAFISKATEFYNNGLLDQLFLVSLLFLFGCLTLIVLSLLCYRYTTKPVIITILLVSSVTSYFMNNYQTIFNPSMLQSMLETNYSETRDLLSIKLVLYVLLLGVLPAWLVYKINIIYPHGLRGVWTRTKLVGITLLSIVVILFSFSDYYYSFFREHKTVRYYANPGMYLFSTAKILSDLTRTSHTELVKTGEDAKTPADDKHRELVIMVVGETARHDHFSLNGYAKNTNPLLQQQNVFNLTNMWSCGTLTAISVPCMFSKYSTDQYDKDQVRSTENALDVLAHAGVNVLWRDNNSSSKGVAERIETQDFRKAGTNPICDPECRDIGMLKGLQEYINSHPKGDIFIVLHQMGQHGPAYYKRYPAEFEHFTPVCKTNHLESCSKEEIENAYDNAILYTDYFLSEVINILKTNNAAFETAMFYISDHGESLGENGIYLHGLPNFVAPEAQRHVPAMLWLGESMDDVDRTALKSRQDKKYSHDNVFHTILGLLEIESAEYNPLLDILKN